MAPPSWWRCMPGGSCWSICLHLLQLPGGCTKVPLHTCSYVGVLG